MILDVFRYLVFGIAVVSAGIAVGSWAVRTRRLDPFGRTARLVRKIGDPVLDPLETWLLKRGHSPDGAGWWLVGITVGGGLILITAAEWLVGVLFVTSRAVARGPAGVVQVIIYYGSNALLLSIIVRVFASWFGKDRWTPWLRPLYALTDWIIAPLRRIIPPIGMFDITPIAAWFLIIVVRNWLISLLG